MFSFVSKVYERLFPPAVKDDFWKNRKVVADLAISPIGTGASMSSQLRTCGEILAKPEYHLKSTMHAFGTNLEGKLEDIEAAVRDCIATLHRQKVPRVSATLTISSRIDKEQSLKDRMKII